MKGQSSMIMIVIVLMMFVAIVVFLLQLASTAGNQKYTVMYANNLLLSVMRTDTGHTDSRCKLVSDLVFCAYFTPEWECGTDGNCLELANKTIKDYMTLFSNQTTSVKYLFSATPTFVSRDPEGAPISLDIGDKALKKSRETFKVFSHPLVLSKTLGPNQYTLRLQLIIANK